MYNLTREDARLLGHAVPVVLLAAGLLHHDLKLFYSSLFLSFAWITGVNLGLSTLMHIVLSCSTARKLQTDRPAPRPGKRAPVLMDTWSALVESTRAALTVACLVAWPLARLRSGAPTAFADTLEEASPLGIAPLYFFKIVAGVFIADAWNYWKHRTLHHPVLWALHRTHHQYKDPNTFAGFAIHPVEALLTFCPVLFVCQTTIKLWWDWHAPVIIPFIALNFYLHCGFEIRALERLLRPLFINTSTFHNIHHEKTVTHFGEMLIVWDLLCKTGAQPTKP